jgi:hypothetical protein
VELAEEAQRKLERLEREREADSAASALRDAHSTPHPAPGPLAVAASRVVSEEEAEMWADYRENGADFSAGDNVGDPEARFEQLREEAKCFGLWNPDATARRLGFGDAPEVPEDVEDDYLGEIMRDAGELECLWSLEVVDTGNGRKVVRYDHMIMAFDSWRRVSFLLSLLDVAASRILRLSWTC